MFLLFHALLLLWRQTILSYSTARFTSFPLFYTAENLETMCDSCMCDVWTLFGSTRYFLLSWINPIRLLYSHLDRSFFSVTWIFFFFFKWGLILRVFSSRFWRFFVIYWIRFWGFFVLYWIDITLTSDQWVCLCASFRRCHLSNHLN